jgi:hypothetical protein
MEPVPWQDWGSDPPSPTTETDMNDVPTFPLAGFDSEPVLALDACIIRFRYLLSPMSQDTAETVSLIVHSAELRILGQRILDIAGALERNAIQVPPDLQN